MQRIPLRGSDRGRHRALHRPLDRASSRSRRWSRRSSARRRATRSSSARSCACWSPKGGSGRAAVGAAVERQHPGERARGRRPAAGPAVGGVQRGAGGRLGRRARVHAAGAGAGQRAARRTSCWTRWRRRSRRGWSQEEAAPGRYRFTHALVQDTLYGELSAGRRLRLHAAVGQALEQLHAANLAPYYGELAHHFAAAAPAGQRDQSGRLRGQGRRPGHGPARLGNGHPALRARPAGDRPASRTGPGPALRRAAGPRRRRSIPHRPRRERVPGGRESFLQARRDRPGARRVRPAGARRARIRRHQRRAHAGGLQQVRLLEEALALAPEGDSALKARVMARLAVDYRVLADSADAHRRAERRGAGHGAAPRRPGGARLRPRRPVLGDLGPDNLDERLALVAEAKRAARSGRRLSITSGATMFA